MIRIRQPFFSIASATIFGLLGLLYGIEAATGTAAFVAGFELNQSTAWAFSGLLFLMAYFALVHLKD